MNYGTDEYLEFPDNTILEILSTRFNRMLVT